MNISDINIKIKELMKTRNNPNDDFFNSITEMMNSISESTEPVIMTKLYSLKTMGLLALSRNNEIHECFEKIEIIRQAFPDNHELQVLAYSSLGTFNWNTSNFQKALEQFQEASKHEPNIVSNLLLKQKIGMAYFKLNDYKNTIIYMSEVYEKKDLIIDDLARAETISWIAVVYNEIGMYDKAQTFSQEALEINLRINNLHGLCTNYNTIGLVNKSMGFNEQSLNFFLKAETYALKINSFIHLANTYNNIAIVYQSTSKNTQAISFYEKSIFYRKKCNQKDQLAITYKNLIFLLIELGQIDQAKLLYEEQLKIYEQIKTPKTKSIILFCQTFIERYNKNYVKVFQYLEENLKLSQDINYLPNIQCIYNFFSQFYEEIYDYKNALKYQRLLSAIDAEIVNKEEKNLIEILNAQHQQIIDRYTLDKKIKEEKIKAVLAMAVTANHEINQPLMQIQGNMELLNETLKNYELSEKQTKFINRVYNGIDKINDVLDKFLTNTNISFIEYIADNEMVSFD